MILSGGSLEVETPSGVASVLGSYLKVEFDPEGETLELTCLEGDCTAVTLDDHTINFTDGQKVVIRRDPNTGKWVVEEGPMNSGDFNEWLENNPEALALVQAGLAGLGGPSSGGSCMALLEPVNSADFFTFGGVNFAWEPMAGAASYVLEFVYPSGLVVQFETTETSMTRYLESMSPGGGYSWTVSAYAEDGAPICTAESFDFTKADTGAWLEAQRDKKGEPDKCDPCDPNHNSGCYDEDYYYEFCTGEGQGY